MNGEGDFSMSDKWEMRLRAGIPTQASHGKCYAVNMGDWMALLHETPWLAQLWQPFFTGEAIEAEGSSNATGPAFVVDMTPDRWEACRAIVRTIWKDKNYPLRLYEYRVGKGWVRV